MASRNTVKRCFNLKLREISFLCHYHFTALFASHLCVCETLKPICTKITLINVSKVIFISQEQHADNIIKQILESYGKLGEPLARRSTHE